YTYIPTYSIFSLSLHDALPIFFISCRICNDVPGRYIGCGYFLRRMEQSITQHWQFTSCRLDNRTGMGNCVDAIKITDNCRCTNVDSLDTAPFSGRPTVDAMLESFNPLSVCLSRYIGIMENIGYVVNVRSHWY